MFRTNEPVGFRTRRISLLNVRNQSMQSALSTLPYAFFKWSAYGGDVQTKSTDSSGIARRSCAESAQNIAPSRVEYAGRGVSTRALGCPGSVRSIGLRLRLLMGAQRSRSTRPSAGKLPFPEEPS